MKMEHGTSHYMGVDIGTSSVKAVLFTQDGHALSEGHHGYDLIPGAEGQAELNPDDVLEALVVAIRHCVDRSGLSAGAVAGVGFSCQHHSLMAMDDQGRPLTRLMTWADNRAMAEAEMIAGIPEVEALYHKTGCRVQHPMYPLAKILWLRKHEPELFRKTDKFVTIKDYLFFRLFGGWWTDYTLASAQGYYDLAAQRWDTGLVEGLLGLSLDRLPTVVPCTHVVKGMDPEWARRLGLDPEVPFALGSGDGIMANLGCGVTSREAFSSTIGTSGAIRTTVDAPLTASDGSTWCYSFTEDKWVAGGAINNGSVALSWLRREFGAQYREDLEKDEHLPSGMDRLADGIVPGSDGLLFLPYLLGERCPDWNAQATGMIAGLQFTHTRAHLVRAMMEGVTFRLFTVDRALSRLCGGGGVLRASGGYVHSDFWLQLQADLFGREVQVSGVTETSALGAAYLAMVAVGAESGFTKGLPSMAPIRSLQPRPEVAAFYQTWRERAESFYRTMFPV